MENKFFELKIIRANGNESVMVEWVDVQSPNGNFVVAYNSLPIISLLKDRGKFKYKEKGIIEEFDTYGGIFKVENNKAIVILTTDFI
ncbi:hypothetical protein GF322_02235 [Candidatus Dependentiae bacterium]|nr:hypothetical protein [Candidatus Dependentiae bacterium]